MKNRDIGNWVSFFQKVALSGGSLEGAYRDGIDYLINLSGFPTDLH